MTDKLLDGFDTNGTLGDLTEISESRHNQLFQHALIDAQNSLEQAQKTAREKSLTITVDASRLSGTNGFDNWLVTPSGKVTRQLVPFEQVGQLLEQAPAGHRITDGQLNHDKSDAARLFARMAYNGLWSPSGTNWQPIRSLVLEGKDASAIFGISVPSQALVVMTRKKYSSILGDVAGLCSISHDPHAEYIDLGIWIQIALLTASMHGWSLVQKDILGKPARGLVKFLKAKAGNMEQGDSVALLELSSSLETGEHIPAYVLYPRSSVRLAQSPDAPGLLQSSQFDRLVEARSTQRVASPTGVLSRQDIKWLWDHALEHVSGNWSQSSENLKFLSFTKADDVPAEIGKAMKKGIEGPGGLLSRVNMENIRMNIPYCPGESEPLQAQDIPEHLYRTLTSSGQYRLEQGLLLDHRTKALTPARLVKLVRMLAKSFGRFFLSFQNTHPVLGIIMVRAGLGSREQVLAYEFAGRIAAHMSVLARARGWVSIIKSGPVEIARDSIQELLAKNSQLDDEAKAIRTGKLNALLTFQVGLPLGPYELVSEGMPGEHNGLLERKLDKRAGRASIKRHHIPLEWTQT